MKNIYHTGLFCFCFLMLLSFSVTAQCTATISGDNCGGNLITVNPGTENVNDVLWLKNGVPSMIRTTYASFGCVVTKGLDIPSGIAFDKEGNMYVSEYRNNSIVKFLKGSDTGFVIAGGNGKGNNFNQLNGPEDVQVDTEGNIFIADVYNYRIMKWSPGAITGQLVAGGSQGSGLNQFNWPNALSLDRFGNIYVADVFNNRIVKWTPGAQAGIVVAGSTDSHGAGLNQLYHPLGIVVDDSGYMYISDFLNYRIQKWAPGATQGVTVAGGIGSSSDGPDKVLPEELCLDKKGNIFVIDSYTQGVKKWQPGIKNGYTVAGGYGLGYSPYQLYFPRGVCVNDKGDIYVAVGGDGEPGHGVIELFHKTLTADTNYYTAKANTNYNAIIHMQSNCIGLSPVFEVKTTPLKPSPITGAFSLAPLQTDVSYSVTGKAGNKYHWAFPKGVQVISGQGTATITVNWSDNSGYMSVHAMNQCAVSDNRHAYVSVASQMDNLSEVRGAEDSAADWLLVYPNPAKDRISVAYHASLNEAFTVRESDLAGKTVLIQRCNFELKDTNIQLNIAQLTPGIYMVGVYGNKSIPLTSKLVKE